MWFSSATKYFLAILGSAFAYWLMGEWILSVPYFSSHVSPVWPSAGIGMASLLLFERKIWPGIALGAFFLDYTHGAPLSLALGGASGAVLQAWVGATLLLRFGVHHRLDRLQDAMWLIGLGAIASPTVNATCSTLTLVSAGRLGNASVLATWSTFWLGDGMGILTVMPVLLLLSQIRSPLSLSSRRVLETLLWFLALAGSSWLIFHCPVPASLVQYPIEYLPFPLLIWASLRFGQLPAVAGSGAVVAIAISGAVQDLGPFAVRAELSDHSPIWLLQAFMGVVVSTTLLLSTAVRQQRATQTLLRQREASLRNAQRIAKLGHWDYDRQTRRWTYSMELCQLLGLPSDETAEGGPLESRHVNGRNTIVDLVSTADRERIQTLFSRAMDEHQPYVAQYGLTLPTGECRQVIEQVEVGAQRITGIIQDVTEQAQAEYALRESEEKFSKAFGFSPDAMTISTLEDGRFIDVNDSFLNLLGYQRHEVINRTVYDLNLWANWSDRQWLIDQLCQHHTIRNKEFELRDRWGKPAHALASAEVINIRGNLCLLLIARDITEQKRTDEQLRLSMERDRLLGTLALHIRQTLDITDMLNTTVGEVRQLLQASRVFIGRFDASGQGTVVAESVLPDYSSLIGEPLEEDVYQDICQIFKHLPVVAIDDMEHLDHFPGLSFLHKCVQCYQVKAALGVPILVNNALYGVLVAHHCDAPRPWQAFEKELMEQLATQVAIALQQGELYAQVQRLNSGLERLVHERTQQLEEKMAELQEMNQLRDMFLHAMSHDLITTVRGNLMVLHSFQNQTSDPIAVKRQCLNRMIEAGECQLSKLSALKEAYTFKTEGVQLHCAPMQFQDRVQSAVAHLQPLIEKNHATVTIYGTDNFPQLIADSLLMGRVFEHLIRNAVIHNPPGVQVSIHLQRTDQNAICTVQDTGVGIPPNLCNRLFDLCMGTPDQPKLTGISLGLYFCSRVIEAHGGTIAVSSHPNEGTAFTVSIPWNQPSADLTANAKGHSLMHRSHD